LFSNVDYPSLLCDCSARVYLVGDLKFYAQMAGREGMSSYWCMWCTLHPSELEKNIRGAERGKGKERRCCGAHLEFH